jgi:hypothetical protein
LASRLERLLDEHADDRPAVRAAYRRAMHLELAFFDAALLPSGEHHLGCRDAKTTYCSTSRSKPASAA